MKIYAESETVWHCQGDILLQYKKSSEVYIVIDNFDGEQDESHFDGIGLRDRIQRYPDIVSIELKQNDETLLDIYVPWNPKDEYSNSWQKIKPHPFNKKEGLAISIKESNGE